MPEPGILYIVATPIGNLGDLSPRAADTLKEVDLIAAEDTRVTRKLLSANDIHTPMISYFEGAREELSRKKILEELEMGKNVALVSDAGSPAISDPGYKIVEEAVEREIPLALIPGPSAMIGALQLSALPTDRFAFFGFPARKGKARDRIFEQMRAFAGTVVLYESPNRVADLLADLSQRFPDSPAAVCRELTKLFEETVRGTVTELAERFAKLPARGEVAIVLDLSGEVETAGLPDMTKILKLQKQLGLSDKDTATAVSVLTGAAKNTIYRELIRRKEQ